MKSFSKFGLSSIIILILTGFVIQLRAGFWIYDIYSHIQNEKKVIKNIQSLNINSIANINPKALNDLALLSTQNLDGLKQDLSPLFPVLNAFSFIPVLGPDLAEIEPGINYGLAVSNLAVNITSFSQPFWQFLQPGSSDLPANERFYQALLQSQTDLEKSKAAIDQLIKTRSAINPDIYPNEIHDKIHILDLLTPKMQKGLNGLSLIPELLGMSHPTTYLILLQNHDELRATGGFITSIGLLRLDQGKITMLDFEDSTHLNYVSKVLIPPEPIHKIMMANYWVPRDANWSPDFPTSARQTQILYFSSTGYPTDGVIAFDQSFLESLLQISGPVHLGQNLPDITADNFESEIIKIKQGAIESNDFYGRKSFISIIGKAMVNNLLHVHDLATFEKLAEIISNQSLSGHLMFYSNDVSIQSFLENEPISGKVDPGLDDYLLLVDSNISFSKNDPQIYRSLSYNLDLGDISKPYAKIIINHKNNGVGDEPCNELNSTFHLHDYSFPRCYWDYWRLYINSKNNVTQAKFDPNPESYFKDEFRWKNTLDMQTGEGGTLMLGGLSVIAQQQTRQIEINISLPPTVLKTQKDGSLVYRLRIQKQAGIDGMLFSLNVTPPDGFLLTDSTLKISPQDPPLLKWQGVVTHSGEIELVFSKNSTNPIH